MGFLSWLESTGYARWISEGLYAYPLLLTLHAIGLAIIIGIVFVLDLRLLGFYRTIPCASLSKFLNIAWFGIVLNVLTGLSIFMTQATSYITSVPFLLKITFVIIGSVNLAYMQKILKRDSASWDAAGAIPLTGLVLAGSSLVFWTLAVIMGRLIAYF